MRRIERVPLSGRIEQDLQRKQQAADGNRGRGEFKVTKTWDRARRTRPLKAVEKVLKEMAGPRERCMYCVDSHGTDIEHFWPKGNYPEKMFVWTNLLLCCTECGRLKGDLFPLGGHQPLLIDPTLEDPWSFLDFDPDTGNIVARFDVAAQAFSPKGEATVEVLQLDRREALATGYQKTYKRLKHLLDSQRCADLRDADDHGIIDWFLKHEMP